MSDLGVVGAGIATPAANGRRAEYAEATRRAVMVSARTLFRERGYFATRVRDIAEAARVAPATVYAVGGGKEALLHAWMNEWLTGPEFTDNHQRLEALRDPAAVLRLTATSVGALYEGWRDIIAVAVTTAPHDESVAATLAAAKAQYRSGFATIAGRLNELGALRQDVTTAEAADILWFYFGFPAYGSMIEDNAWPVDRVTRWLTDAAGSALLAQDRPS